MSRRANAYVAFLGAAILALAASGTASASGGGSGGGPGGGGSGGVGLGGGPGVSHAASANTGLAASTRFIGGKIGAVAPGDVAVSAALNGVTISTTASAMLGGQLVISGVAPQSTAGSTVQIQRL
ncbi:MAG TPA: hypothetical protein VIX82_12790, partial [Solirubrobacteraceae bacterium]